MLLWKMYLGYEWNKKYIIKIMNLLMEIKEEMKGNSNEE